MLPPFTQSFNRCSLTTPPVTRVTGVNQTANADTNVSLYFWSSANLSFGCTSSWLSVMCGFTAEWMWRFLVYWKECTCMLDVFVLTVCLFVLLWLWHVQKVFRWQRVQCAIKCAMWNVLMSRGGAGPGFSVNCDFNAAVFPVVNVLVQEWYCLVSFIFLCESYNCRCCSDKWVLAPFLQNVSDVSIQECGFTVNGCCINCFCFKVLLKKKSAHEGR